MARPPKLSEEELKIYLDRFPKWQRKGDTIEREFVAANFPAIVGYLNAIAILAETLDHHPDLFIYGWNKLRVTLSTHDQGGLTELDFKLAEKIESLNF